MIGQNVVAMQGRVARDPELRYTREGTAICHFSIQISVKQGKTDFFNWTIWGDQGEKFGKRYKKGDIVNVHGKAVMDQWDDKQTGKNRTAIKFVGSYSLACLPYEEEDENPSPPPERPKQAPAAARGSTEEQGEFGDDDDIPF